MENTVILVIGKVNDAPNQIRYQRIKALAQRFRLHVVTPAPLPAVLCEYVQEVHVVTGTLPRWRKCMDLAQHLSSHESVIVHTVYAPHYLVAGFLCKIRFPVRWVYDLYDHPSLNWSTSRGLSRAVKRLFWVAASRLVRMADVWIVGMHPGILSHMPTPTPKCRLVLTGPGVISSEMEARTTRKAPADDIGKLVICYAGPVTKERGMDVLAQWALDYQGPPALLHLIGQHNDAGARLIEDITTCAAGRNLQIIRHGWLPHDWVLEILKTGDIGICLIDPKVLNYRYAYPIKVVEYMSQGLIPVATDSHGVRNFIRHGENGFVSRYDSQSFARTMTDAVDILADEERKKVIAANARQTVAHLDWDEVNRRLIVDLQTALAADA